MGADDSHDGGGPAIPAAAHVRTSHHAVLQAQPLLSPLPAFPLFLARTHVHVRQPERRRADPRKLPAAYRTLVLVHLADATAAAVVRGRGARRGLDGARVPSATCGDSGLFGRARVLTYSVARGDPAPVTAARAGGPLRALAARAARTPLAARPAFAPPPRVHPRRAYHHVGRQRRLSVRSLAAPDWFAGWQLACTALPLSSDDVGWRAPARTVLYHYQRIIPARLPVPSHTQSL